MSNDEFKLLVSKCYRYEDVQLVLHNNNIIMNIKDIKLLMKHFNISLSKYNLLQYQPQHEYKFILLDNGAELYIDNILFDITDKSILNIDMKEMIYGIFPAVKTGYNIAKTKDFMIPAQFKILVYQIYLFKHVHYYIYYYFIKELLKVKQYIIFHINLLVDYLKTRHMVIEVF